MPKEKKGLGIGLDALFGVDENEEAELQILPITKVEPRQDQPREIFDEQSMQELADSIAQYGLIQPITARRLDSGYYQIIAGERRWRAARLAGLTEVPVDLTAGRHDQNTPIPLAKAWFDQLSAPRKEWIWFEKSAHSPIKNEPELWGATVRDIVLKEEAARKPMDETANP